ncbi:FtsX-like permease family protein [Streptomyces sp. CAU 1734]|uniref:ABC transporter permease n=1 Tax=Streptomyces sp. CAU 1734 TaxID=3140360 RepID=UPI003260F806
MRAVAPWVRTRLRTAPLAAVALALLVAVTSFLASVYPRAVDAQESEGLTHALRTTPPDERGLRFSVAPAEFETPEERARLLRPARLREMNRTLLAGLPEPLRADTRQADFGARTTVPVPASSEWLPLLEGGMPQFTLTARSGLAEHSTLRSGRLPKAGPTAPGARLVEGAVTARTAADLNITVGATVSLPREGTEGPLGVRITGIVEPAGPGRAYWAAEPVLRAPAKVYEGTPPAPHWHGGLFLAPEAAPALLSLMTETEAYWRIPLDPAGLRIGDLPRLKAAIASVDGGPAGAALRSSVDSALVIETGVDSVLIRYDETRTAIGAVTAVAGFGAAAVAVIVLLMAGGLATIRRRTELTLLRARGGSVAGLAGRLLAETAVVALPAAAGGWALARAVVPEGRPLPSLSAAGAVALVACAVLPLRVVFTHRRLRTGGERDDAVRARPSRRRTVAEVTVLALAVAAVETLRRRGTAEGGADELVSAAPVLVAVVAALVLARLYPLPLRLAALPMARRRGAIGFLSLARAGRSPVPAGLVLLALIVALTTAAFGGSVLAGVSDARSGASLAAVGGDARIEARAEELPAGLAERVRKVSGVRVVAPVRREFDLNLRDGDQTVVTMLAVDPASYATLSERTGMGRFGTGELRKRGGVLPALVSPAVAERLGSGPVTVAGEDGTFTVRVAAVSESTPAMNTGNFLVVDASGLPAERAPSALLVDGPGTSGPELREAVGEAGTVLLRSAVRDRFVESPLQDGAERIYTAAVAASAGFAVLAILLSLLQAAPERSALLARLRTMGLTRRQGRRLLVLESLPQVLLAAAGGALVGWAAIALLSPGVDLGRLALASQEGVASLGAPRLRAESWSLLLPALAVVVIAASVAGAQAWLATRRTATTELRVGDAR